MGNNIFLSDNMAHSLKFERLINLEPRVIIGVHGIYNQENPFGREQISFSENSKLKELKSFYETDNALIFEFEENSKLHFMKDKNKIILRIVDLDTNIDITKEMCPGLRNFFRNPSFCSPHFDKIENFIKIPDENN